MGDGLKPEDEYLSNVCMAVSVLAFAAAASAASFCFAMRAAASPDGPVNPAPGIKGVGAEGDTVFAMAGGCAWACGGVDGVVRGLEVGVLPASAAALAAS